MQNKWNLVLIIIKKHVGLSTHLSGKNSIHINYLMGLQDPVYDYFAKICIMEICKYIHKEKNRMNLI